MGQIIQFDRLWKSKFNAELSTIVEPMRQPLMDALEHIYKVEKKGGEYEQLATETLPVYASILESLFPDTYQELFGADHE